MICPPSFDIRSCLLLKTISGIHNRRDSYLGLRETLRLYFVLNFCLREFPLSAVANLFEFRCQQKQLLLLSYKICPCCLYQLPGALKKVYAFGGLWNNQRNLGGTHGAKPQFKDDIHLPLKGNVSIHKDRVYLTCQVIHQNIGL